MKFDDFKDKIIYTVELKDEIFYITLHDTRSPFHVTFHYHKGSGFLPNPALDDHQDLLQLDKTCPGKATQTDVGSIC